MTSEDDSLLTAYMDGQLSPDQIQAVAEFVSSVAGK